MFYLFAVEIHRLEALWRIVTWVVDYWRNRMKSQYVLGLKQFQGIQRFHISKIQPFPHFFLSIQDCWHSKNRPTQQFSISDKLIRRETLPCWLSLPMMNTLQVWRRIHSDHTVRIKWFPSTWRSPAVKDSGHGQQLPSCPLSWCIFLLWGHAAHVNKMTDFMKKVTFSQYGENLDNICTSWAPKSNKIKFACCKEFEC